MPRDEGNGGRKERGERKKGAPSQFKWVDVSCDSHAFRHVTSHTGSPPGAWTDEDVLMSILHDEDQAKVRKMGILQLTCAMKSTGRYSSLGEAKTSSNFINKVIGLD